MAPEEKKQEKIDYVQCDAIVADANYRQTQACIRIDAITEQMRDLRLRANEGNEAVAVEMRRRIGLCCTEIQQWQKTKRGATELIMNVLRNKGGDGTTPGGGGVDSITPGGGGADSITPGGGG
eukprot:17994_1